MRIGFLGLGKMGTPMALRLLAAGHELSVWNRTRRAYRTAAPRRRNRRSHAGEAELGADAVITMLFDDAAHEEVLFGANGLLDALVPGGLHISCSTISVALSERLTQEHARRGIDFVAAPVFGRPNVAAEGRLWIVVAGADDAVDPRASPARATVARHLRSRQGAAAGPCRQAGRQLPHQRHDSLARPSRLSLPTAQGIEPEAFFEAVNSALFQSPFYAAYADVMLHPRTNPARQSISAPRMLACSTRPHTAHTSA